MSSLVGRPTSSDWKKAPLPEELETGYLTLEHEGNVVDLTDLVDTDSFFEGEIQPHSSVSTWFLAHLSG